LKAPSVHWSDFRFNAGRLSLDLPATVRRRSSTPHDVLAAPAEAARWLHEAGLTDRQLRLRSAQVQQLLELREAIWAAADARAQQRRPASAALRVINRAAAYPLPVPRLDPQTLARVLLARDAFHSALSAIARDAIELLAGAEARRIKACAQPDCRMLFFDGSPAERRRWCSMDRCGSRAKGTASRLKRSTRTAAPRRGGAHSRASERPG